MLESHLPPRGPGAHGGARNKIRILPADQENSCST